MAFSYDCTYSLQAKRLTPINKRLGVRLAVDESISSPIQWNHDNFFDKFLNGDDSIDYNPVTAYVRYDRVNYQNKIYECLEDCTGIEPTNTAYWYKALDDFRGANERMKYNFQRLNMEYMLNRWFKTTFVQPNALDTRSDFWIESNTRDSNTFYVGEDSYYNGVFHTAAVPEFSTQSDDYIGEDASFPVGANFTVYYPLGVIDLTSNPLYYQMVALTNKYKIFGSTVAYIAY